MTPNITLFMIFMIIPIFFTFYISFYRWGILGEAEFVGFENYTRMFKDPVFWVSLKNTVYYTVGTVPFEMVLGLAGALLLNHKIPFRSFFRTVFFAPVVVSLVSTGLIWAWMYNPDYGLVNYVLSKIGIEGVNWLSSAETAMPAIIITTLWVRIGYSMVIYLAGLQSIPKSLYESAEIDGAGSLRKLWYITLPLLKNTTIFVLVIEIIHGFMVFDLVYTMTNGGPGYTTTVVVQYIYQKAFVEGDMGYASAVGTVFFLFILTLTMLQLRLGREKDEL